MFSLIDEITSSFSVKDLKNSSKYKIINMGGSALYIQGYKTIEKFSDISIILKIKNGSIFVKGEKLEIKEYYSDCIYIVGNIKSVEVE